MQKLVEGGKPYAGMETQMPYLGNVCGMPSGEGREADVLDEEQMLEMRSTRRS